MRPDYRFKDILRGLWDNPDDEIWERLEMDIFDEDDRWFWDGTTEYPIWLGDI